MPDFFEGQYLRVAVHYQMNQSPGSKFVNTMAFQGGGMIGSFDDLLVCLDAVFDSWVTNWGPIMSNQLDIVKVTGEVIIAIGDTPGPMFESTRAQTAFGNAGAPLPYQNCGLVRTLSALPGRSGKHRYYTPGVMPVNVTANELTSVAQASYLAAANAVSLVAVGVSGLTLNMCHLEIASPSNILTAASQIVQVKVDKVIRAQRRRQPDRGT